MLSEWIFEGFRDCWDLIEQGEWGTYIRTYFSKVTVIKLKFDRGEFHGSLDWGFEFLWVGGYIHSRAEMRNEINPL